MNKNQYSVEILVGGQPAREHFATINGSYKTFIEGFRGTPYSIRLRNNSNQKVLAIVSVDGLNCVSGKPSGSTAGRGYIVQSFGSVEIKGFRISDSEVSQFKFSNKSKSYAASKGGEQNAGIISVNFIAEKVKPIVNLPETDVFPWPTPWVTPYEPKPYWIDDYRYRVTCDSFSPESQNVSYSNSLLSESASPKIKKQYLGAGGQSVSPDLGTQFGPKVTDKITRAHFEKGEVVASFDFYYSTKTRLEEMGVKITEEKSIDLPGGFEDNSRYCNPPEGWKS